VAEEPEWGLRRDARGLHSIGKVEDESAVRIMVTEPQVGRNGEPTLRDLSEALTAVYGTDYGIHSPASISRFTDMARQAESYRKGRVLLAGDSAHVHYPVGGQGLNTGVQDAVNLGWKLAAVVHGTVPDSLLDTYTAERHPVAARTLQATMAATVLQRGDDHHAALRDSVGEMLSMDEPRRRFGGMAAGLDTRYDLGDGHPLLGRRMPDIDLVADGGAERVYDLMHDARAVLLNFGEPDGGSADPWGDRIQMGGAEQDAEWEQPGIGTVGAPSAVLVRPDGYVAWAGELGDPALPVALTTWFGPA
jgi:hypothetical protein